MHFRLRAAAPDRPLPITAPFPSPPSGRSTTPRRSLSRLLFSSHIHFLEMSGGTINATELVATIINQKENLVEGIQYAQEIIDGSMTILLMTAKGHLRRKRPAWPHACGDRKKRTTPTAFSFESFAYLNLGYTNVRELGPGRDRRHHAGRGEDPGTAGEGYEDLHLPLGLLRLSFLLLRRGSAWKKCGITAALPWARRDPRIPGYRGRRSGFGNGPCHRLRKRFGHSFFPSVHQVYAYLAPFLHAHHPEQAEPDRPK